MIYVIQFTCKHTICLNVNIYIYIYTHAHRHCATARVLVIKLHQRAGYSEDEEAELTSSAMPTRRPGFLA